MKNILLVALSAVLLSACNSSTSAPAQTQPATTPSVEINDQAAAPTSYTYNLAEQNESGQTGTLTLTDTEAGGVSAVLALTGGEFTAPQPAHIHVGHCPTPGTVKYPLVNVVDGKSTTELDVSMEEILASAPELSVNVHQSAAESKVYTSCADIQ